MESKWVRLGVSATTINELSIPGALPGHYWRAPLPGVGLNEISNQDICV